MKRFIKTLVIYTLAAVILAGCSTSKISEQLRYKVLVESLEGISTSPSGGWIIKLRVNNMTSRQPTLHHGEGEIYIDGELIRKDGLFVVEDLLPLNPENLK